jgi:hypothetical protein
MPASFEPGMSGNPAPTLQRNVQHEVRWRRGWRGGAKDARMVESINSKAQKANVRTVLQRCQPGDHWGVVPGNGLFRLWRHPV